MCLKSVTLVVDEPTNEEHTGYKVVYLYNDLPKPTYYKANGESAWNGYTLPTNKWLVSTPKLTYSEQGWTQYITGFHIFTTLDDARDWRHASHVIQVKYRFVIYHGTEAKNQIVHIAREMYIPWPQTPIAIE